MVDISECFLLIIITPWGKAAFNSLARDELIDLIGGFICNACRYCIGVCDYVSKRFCKRMHKLT